MILVLSQQFRFAKSHNFVVRLTVFTWISGCCGTVESPHGKLTSHIISFLSTKKCFPQDIFLSTILHIRIQIQIDKFWINALVSLVILFCIWCWFQSRIFSFVVCVMYQKDECASPVLLCNQICSSKRASSAAKLQQQKTNKQWLKELFRVFKNGLTSIFSPRLITHFEQNALILYDWRDFVQC